MKKILFLVICLLLINLVSAEKAEDIKLNNFVNDYANVLDEAQEKEISAKLKEIYDSKTAEFSVVIVKSLEGAPIEDFSFKVAEGKLGDKENNNGLLLLISTEDREYRFEVGRGLEPILNDAKIGRVGRKELVPYLKNGDYYNGTLSSVNAISEILENNNLEIADNFDLGLAEFSPMLIIILSLIVIFFFIIFFIKLAKEIKKAKKEHGGKFDEDKLFTAGYLGSRILRDGFKGGGFGGGFGGFGSGGFSGGGASGRF